ncbi:uncharacterized protein LOC132703192 [Cylas formicarius]|uniref:uncharacterized protein LOC132703192 n=1 Tax=Cylas formicarius TaxID=197179 RepID=UPI002958BCB0|nr:uncharacterized protein LOC132703192 [Cylas formicarius]
MKYVFATQNIFEARKSYKLEPNLINVIICAFCVLFAIAVIAQILYYGNGNSVATNGTAQVSSQVFEKSQPTFRHKQSDSAQGCEMTETCLVRCSEVDITTVAETINYITKDVQCNGEIKLTLVNVLFPNNTMRAGWLNSLDDDVFELIISTPNLSNLGENAFEGKPFTTSSRYLTLTILDSNIRSLKRSTFVASKIQVIQMQSISKRGITVENDVFGPTAIYLETLQFNYLLDDIDALRNITAANTTLSSLRTLDIRYNTFTKLTDKMFFSVPFLEQIVLCDSKITSVEVDAFAGLGSRLRQIDFTSNLLETLPNGLLKNINSIDNKVWVDDNRWRCDCDLQWFKTYLLARNNTNPLMCESVNFKDVDFCPNSSTPVATATDSITTPTPDSHAEVTSTTIMDSDSIDYKFSQILCRSVNKYPFAELRSTNKIFLQEAAFKSRNIDYTLYHVQDSSTVVVTLQGIVKRNDFLIWTNTANLSDYGCVYEIDQDIYMDLQYESTYTICLANNDTVDIFALTNKECTALNIALEWGKRAWITNNDMMYAIIVLVVSVLLGVVCASVIVYFVVRQHPELIKGNKRVILVKNKSAPEFLVMPDYTKRNTLLSVYTNSDGYLTPKYRRCKNYQNPLSRELINDPIHSNEVSENIYEAPPSPPHHPRERRDSYQPYIHSNM